MKEILITLLSVCALEAADMKTWKRVFFDPCTDNWERNWFLDGSKGKVRNTPEGMILTSGPGVREDASHVVLWTRESFSGDIRVEYDFTRIDKMEDETSVCIFYLQATGTGAGPFEEDIFLWRKLREEPAMSLYFMNMNCYHVSYACTGGADRDYVRARRYPAKTQKDFQYGTRLDPSYENVDRFHPGDTYRFAFEKIGTNLTFTASRGGKTDTFDWNTSGFPPIISGRLGLRQMFARESRYARFEVFQ